MKELIKKLIRMSGHELIHLHAKGRTADSGTATLYRVKLNELEALFLVFDPKDSIQRWHVSGLFYEQEELAIIEKYFKGGVFVDVGSNVGNHAVYFGIQNPHSQIICFEPNPETFSILQFNIARNRLSDQIVAHNIGLSDSEKLFDMIIPEGNIGGTSIQTLSASGDTAPAQVHKASFLAGDVYFKDMRVDFIKIDVEGHEVNCISGLWSTIIRDRPGIFIEVTSLTEREIMCRFRDIGYFVKDTYSRYNGINNLLILPAEE